MSAQPGEVTELLMMWSQGDSLALQRLTPIVYDELRLLAHRRLSRESPGHVLQTTGLVHEVFLRFIDQRRINLAGSSHFYSLAARLMRRILVDFAKSRLAAKRGGGVAQLSLEDDMISLEPDTGILLLDFALDKLANWDDRKAQIVQLKFFGGLTNEETAEFLGISTATVDREWQLARAWLYRHMKSAPPLADATT